MLWFFPQNYLSTEGGALMRLNFSINQLQREFCKRELRI
jgi:hypothetical protein